MFEKGFFDTVSEAFIIAGLPPEIATTVGMWYHKMKNKQDDRREEEYDEDYPDS